jgi:GDP-L-fucose synthase
MDQDFWKSQTVLVTGAHGFVGRHLLKRLVSLKPKSLRTPTSKEVDFRDLVACQTAVKGCDIVIHLAANVGGIGYNQNYPGELFYDNLTMGVHLMEAARQAKVKKFVGLGTICAYPKFTPIPFKEEDLWKGYPEETNAPYGLAKKMLLVQSQAYRKQYKFNSIYLLPVNMYGPHDNFDPDSSHVIPALIRKFTEAIREKRSEVSVWGTGRATREFLYVDDCARAIILATERFNGDEPVNIGAGFEISIHELVTKIGEMTGFKGKIVFDTTKPDGQPRRSVDTSRAKEYFGFSARVRFEEGLRETISWYRRHSRLNK